MPRNVTIDLPANEKQTLEAKGLLDKNRSAVGFVTRAAFQKSAKDRELLVAVAANQVVGFARFHIRRDRSATMYEIVVATEARKRGLGSALIARVCERARGRGAVEIRLKCPEHSDANAFYQKVGFASQGIVPGRKRRLCVWRQAL